MLFRETLCFLLILKSIYKNSRDIPLNFYISNLQYVILKSDKFLNITAHMKILRELGQGERE